MSLRVLIADDHQAFRERERRLLIREGIEVVGEAADGHEALELARSLHPDLVILDISMPVLDGLDTARAMPQVSPGTKTIMLTIHDEIAFVLQAFEAGVSGYVLKRRAAEGSDQSGPDGFRVQEFLELRGRRSAPADTTTAAKPAEEEIRRVRLATAFTWVGSCLALRPSAQVSPVPTGGCVRRLPPRTEFPPRHFYV